MDRLITFHLIYIVILYIFIPVNKKKQFNMNANPTAFQESTRASEKGKEAGRVALLRSHGHVRTTTAAALHRRLAVQQHSCSWSIWSMHAPHDLRSSRATRNV
jgi:hypothetical protein